MDVIDINVFETTEQVTFNVTEQLIQVNVNKVTSAEQIQSDWNQTDTDALDFIKNKPLIPEAITNTSELVNDGEDGINPFITLQDIPEVTGFVPYTGANQDVNLGSNSLSTEKVFLYDAPNDNYGSVHFTDGNFHVEDSDGHPLFVAEDGFLQIHKDATIQSNLFTTDLTEIRNHYLPDNSGTIALTSDIPAPITIDDVPTDGSNNAVSSNGVFDALALKQNAIGYTPENVANKSTNLTSPDNTKYPTTLAIVTELNKTTITVELIDLLTVNFYAPNALRINSTAIISGSGAITLKVNDVAYTLGALITQGAKITVETTTESVYNLIGIYE